MIPKALIEGMDHLRILGNDAVHVEAKVFESIGSTEIEIAIEFTKELFKAIYQYSNLLNKLASLGKRTTT